MYISEIGAILFPVDTKITRVTEGTLPGVVDTGRNLSVTAIFCSTELCFVCSW